MSQPSEETRHHVEKILTTLGQHILQAWPALPPPCAVCGQPIGGPGLVCLLCGQCTCETCKDHHRITATTYTLPAPDVPTE